MERVLIIGSPGAGKSTLATRLAARTGLPLIHLDQLHWQAGWVEGSREAFDAKLDRVLAGPRWIIDGNYGRTLRPRMERADTVIDLDLPAWRCLAQTVGRVLRSYGRVRPDMAPGCPERFDLAFLAYIARFPHGGRQRIERALEPFEGRLTRLRSRAEIDRFLGAFPPRRPLPDKPGGSKASP